MNDNFKYGMLILLILLGLGTFITFIVNVWLEQYKLASFYAILTFTFEALNEIWKKEIIKEE